MTRGRVLLVIFLVAAFGLALWPEAPPGATGAWMRQAGVEPRYETVDGLRIRYVRRGAGPAVVLIHGFASSIVTWRHVLPALARRHDVLALDLPGFGGSDAPADLSPRLYLRLVPAFLDRLGIARASLVGNSLGGAVSAAVAAQDPGRVERLVLIDSAGYNFSAGDRPWLLRVAGSAALGGVLERLPIRRLLVRTGLHQVFQDDAKVPPDLVEEYLAPLWRPGAIASARALLTARDAEFTSLPERIARVRAPTLILWGREDAWIPVAHADRFLAAVPGSRKVVLESCGHMPQEERPEEVVPLLEGFLNGPSVPAPDLPRPLDP